jgi:DNA-binding transcriptional LysR family regulator
MTDMNDLQLRRLDAGLLLVFEATLRLGNLARVGEALGLTPSAISHALARLREIFGDPLFVRRAQGVTPTPRARTLEPDIARALEALRGALSEVGEFRPERIDRAFRILALDAPIATMAPPLLARLAEVAPKARIAFRTLGRDETRRAVASGEADLGVGVYGAALRRERIRDLGEERFVVVARRDHPMIGERLTLEAWLACDHVLVSAAGDFVGAVDAALAERGLARRVRAAVPQFLTAFATVAASDATATVGEGQARAYAGRFGLVVHDAPVPMAPFRLQLLSARGAPDPALDWLIKEILALYGAEFA